MCLHIQCLVMYSDPASLNQQWTKTEHIGMKPNRQWHQSQLEQGKSIQDIQDLHAYTNIKLQMIALSVNCTH